MAITCMNNFYPERLKKVFVVNQPWTLSLLYSVIEPLLDPVTRKKICFLKKQELLVHYFPKETLLVDYGGQWTGDLSGDILGFSTLE